MVHVLIHERLTARIQDISLFGQHSEEVASGLLDLSPVMQLAWSELGGDAEERAEEAVGGGYR